MKKLRFKKIDAFASRNSSGNPAAVIYLNTLEELSEEEKLQIAKELKGFVSEVGFVCPGAETDYELCYFSSEREVQVQNCYQDEQSVYISAPPPKFSTKEIGAVEITMALDSRIDDLDASRPIQIINGGLETLIVPMAGLSQILRVAPKFQKLKEFCLQIGVDILLLYSSEVASQGSKYRTRVFAPTFGYLEDPATGSGNSAFGYYLLAHGIWQGEKIKLEQNGLRDKPNFVQLFSQRTDTGDVRVWFGGGAIVRIDGQYNLE